MLRTVKYRDSDLIVDLLAETGGRLSVMARGARSSGRRFAGALEIGTRLEVLTSRSRGGLANLTEADVLGPLRNIRDDLDRFHQLAYVLEVARLTVREGEGDPRVYGVVAGYLEALELAPATPEGLALLDLGMLAAQGYALRVGRCVVTGQASDGLSLRAGGTVRCSAARVPDAVWVPERALTALAALSAGRADVRLDREAHVALRRAFGRIWESVAGRGLQTVRFL